MVELDEDTYRGLVARSRLPFQFVVKEQKLMEVLGQLAAKSLQLELIMKGGTALNKVYLGEVQRFSEDIDFDYVNKEDDKKKIEKLKQLMKSIDGFAIDGPWRYHSTIRFHCLYYYKEQKNHVRVEFALKHAIKTLEPIKAVSVNSFIYGTTIVGVRCYAFDDLVARKMQALHNRTEGRDIWDCYHAIPKTTNLKKALSLVLSEEKKITVKQFLEETIDHLKSVNIVKKMQIANPYIPQHFRLDWTELRNSLIARLEML